MTNKQKLELTWIGKDGRHRLEPRILVEEPSLSYLAASRKDGDIFNNLMIQGDNLLALRALESEYTGSIKCIFIDPPYNTGSAFSSYDDGIEHSIWLSLIRDRLTLLRNLMADNGSIWITIDDNESHYLKVICDEVFGRSNFVSNVIWEKADSPRMDSTYFSSRHDHILVYSKRKDQFAVKKGVLGSGEVADHYNRRDKDGRPYYTKPLRAMGGDDARKDRPSLYFPLIAPDGTEILPIRKDGSDGRWRWGKERTIDDADLIEWVKGRNGWSPYYRIYGDTESTRPPETIWQHWDVGSNRTSKAEIKAIFGGTKSFETPKPEGLLRQVLLLATDPGDLVLDSFAGSGTTGAVAHKMGRRWIMVELGDHAVTLCVPRLKKMIDGSDPGGVTEAVGWKGGGGFRFCRLAPSLLTKDRFDNWVVTPGYNSTMLAEAVCKLMGFTYAPSQELDEYWRHGHSTETDFIYVTTQSLTHYALEKLSDEVGAHRTLLVCCKAFSARETAFGNLTIRKIPQTVLTKCEWGRDDYSLRIASLPIAKAAPDEEVQEVAVVLPASRRGRPRKEPAAASLFDDDTDLVGEEA